MGVEMMPIFILNQQLLSRGWNIKLLFVIEDDPLFMLNIFNLIKSDENSVMFCFGGIGPLLMILQEK